LSKTNEAVNVNANGIEWWFMGQCCWVDNGWKEVMMLRDIMGMGKVHGWLCLPLTP